MRNYVDFYKDNIEILNLEAQTWIVFRGDNIKNQLNHVTRTLFKKDFLRYLLEDLNYDWRLLYRQPLMIGIQKIN